jgi:hypothetical protein
MDFDISSDSRNRWDFIRDFCKSFGQSYGYSSAGGISWIARCTWIPAFDKATSRKRNRGPKKVSKHHIVDAFTALYITVIVTAAIFAMVTWK